MTFRTGMEVECINDAGTNTLDIPELKNGQHYTIRWVGTQCDIFGEFLGVRLQGVSRPCDRAEDMPFGAFRFRPVQERKASTETGMAILNKLLTPEKIGVGTTDNLRTERAISTLTAEQGAGDAR
jgi:hypothetical protein